MPFLIVTSNVYIYGMSNWRINEKTKKLCEVFYNDTTEQVFTLAIEEAQTNVFLKHECTTKSAFQRKAEMFGLYTLLL